MKSLLSVAVLALVSFTFFSCSSSQQTANVYSDKNSALNGKWELFYIDGPRIAFNGLFPKTKPYLQIDLSNNHVSGFGGCNRIMGPLVTHADSLRLGKLASTMMACTDGMHGETLFLKTLSSVSFFQINADTLALQDTKRNAVLKFLKVADSTQIAK